MKEVLMMFMIFDAGGILVGMVTQYGGKYTTILETLEDADFTVKFLEEKSQITLDIIPNL